MTTARLDELMKRRDAINAQISATRSRERTAKRKRETRRKVLAGAACLYMAEHDAVFAAELHRLLDNFLKRDDERSLFDLAPLDAARDRTA